MEVSIVLQAPYEMQWRVDDNGVPYCIMMEEVVVVAEPYFSITLEEIPDTFYRLDIKDITEGETPMVVGETMSKSEVKDSKYYVDYNGGVVYFSEKMAGRTLKILYYGRGFKRINAKRIAGLDTGGVMTLDLGLEEYQERIAKLENLTVHLQKQIDFLIDELESKGN